MLLSSWASSATTASEGVPDTQPRKENETSRETAEELADTFPICQPEGARVFGWLWAAENLRPARGANKTSMMEGDFARQGGGLPIEETWRIATVGLGYATSFSRRPLGELAALMS